MKKLTFILSLALIGSVSMVSCKSKEKCDAYKSSTAPAKKRSSY
jgi:hypothetical protein